jgi:hypothetical protein
MHDWFFLNFAIFRVVLCRRGKKQQQVLSFIDIATKNQACSCLACAVVMATNFLQRVAPLITALQEGDLFLTLAFRFCFPCTSPSKLFCLHCSCCEQLHHHFTLQPLQPFHVTTTSRYNHFTLQPLHHFTLQPLHVITASRYKRSISTQAVEAALCTN